jgi:4-amino-4-deoxy-L-arabinose transferase-like glycosyltransferase
MSVLLRRWRAWLPLLAVMLAGAALRLYQVGDAPPGLYRDEGYYGLDALGVLRGQFAVYFTANNGREGLFMYLLAPAIALLGRTPQALRIVPALAGVATLLAVYFAGRHLLSHRIGVLSAAVCAFTFWAVALSRVAYRASLLPLVLSAAVALGAWALRRPAQGARLSFRALAAGLACGLVFYTYTSGQFVAALLAAFAILLALVPSLRPVLRLPRGTWLGFGLGLTASLAPLLIWLARHPELYLARADQVSILNPAISGGDPVGALLANLVRAAGMFAWQGDRIWRHNLSLRPVFTDWLAVAFFAGLAVCAWRLIRPPHPAPPSLARPDARPDARPAHLFLLLWLLVFLVPTVLAEDTPHFLRASGALPAACLIAAMGLEAGLGWMSRRGLLNFYAGALPRAISPPALLAVVLLSVTAVNTAGDYFNRYVPHPMTRYWLEDHNVQLARLVNAHAAQYGPQSVRLDERLEQNNPSLRFMSPYVDEGRVNVVGPERQGAGAGTGAEPVLLAVDPNHDWTALREALPAGRLLSVQPGPLAQDDREPAPRRAYIAVQAEPWRPAPALASFDDGIQLHDARIVRGSMSYANVYTVTLFWGTTRPIPEDYAVFVHWLRNGELVAQHDGSPAAGYLPMPAWRAGDGVADEHPVTVPNGRQPGDVIRAGVYRRSDNNRLTVIDQNGNGSGEWVDLTSRLQPSEDGLP